MPIYVFNSLIDVTTHIIGCMCNLFYTDRSYELNSFPIANAALFILKRKKMGMSEITYGK